MGSERRDLVIESIPYRLRRAQVAMHKALARQVAGCGVTADQYVVLRVVGDQPGLALCELAEVIATDPSSIGAAVRLMERRGWLIRRPNPDDGRAYRVMLTRKGRALLERLIDAATPLRAALRQPFDQRERAQFIEYLDRIVDACGGRTQCDDGNEVAIAADSQE
jgi:DNA-binding MarR family transcriptional regulator